MDAGFAQRRFAVIIDRPFRSIHHVTAPPHAFLAEVFRHLPCLVIHVTTDGVVLHANPEALRVTGYAQQELMGQNLWTLLFPGKLFAQVPRFISLVRPSPLLKDVPMTIRTRSGQERIIVWSRHVHRPEEEREPEGGGLTFICIGVDLTDRLVDADRTQLSGADVGNPDHGPTLTAFGPHIGNAGAIDSDIVTPIAISPKALGATGPCPIEQVRDGLAQVDTHINCVCGAFVESETQTANFMRAMVGAGVGAFEAAARVDEAEIRGCEQSVAGIRERVEELLAQYRPEMK
jgi:PAS domain S-box-containing protein